MFYVRGITACLKVPPNRFIQPLWSSCSRYHDDISSKEDHYFSEKKVGISQREQKQLLKQAPASPPDSRVLKVAIIGAPNAGKSTLANKLLGWRFSSVSSKVHTTRHKVIGVRTDGNTQIVFLDTPGLIVPWKMKKYELERSLLVDPHASLQDADLILVVADVGPVANRTRLHLEVLKLLHLHSDKQSVLVLNKVDLVKRKHELLTITRLLTAGMVGGSAGHHTTHRTTTPARDVHVLFARMAAGGQQDSHTSQEDSSSEHTDNTSPINREDSDSLSDSVSKYTNNTSAPSDNVDFSYVESQNVAATNASHNNQTSNFNKSETSQINLTDIEQLYEESDANISSKSAINVTDTDQQQPVPGDVSDSSSRTSRVQYRVDGGEVLTVQIEEGGEGIAEEDEPADVNQEELWEEYELLLKDIEAEVKDDAGFPGFSQVFMVSAKDGDGVEDIKHFLHAAALPGPWLFSPAVVTDQNPRSLARAAVWGKMLDHLPQEVPYQVDIRLVLWEVDDNNVLRAQFDLVCSKKRFLKHTVGIGGETIKKIAAEAKQELMNTFKQEMTLQLAVKATPKVIAGQKKQQQLQKKMERKAQNRRVEAERRKLKPIV